MRALLGLAGAAAAFVMLAPTNAAVSDDDDGDPVIGRAIFVRDNCSSCHGGLAGGGFGPNLRDDRPNDDEVRNAVLNGTRTGMPSYRGLLGARDIKDLIAYFDTLRDDDEPTFTHWWEHIESRFPEQSRCCAPPDEPPHSAQ